MTLQDLGNLGELISGIAVVITLVYLAVQIRQNTKTVRTSTYQALLDSSRSDTELILAHPHLARIYRVGRRDPTELTDEERPLFRMLIGQLLQNYEIMYLQHQHGVIDEEFWGRRRLLLRGILSQPGVRQWWAGRANARRFYDPRFQEIVESLVNEVTALDEPAA